jgi:carboxyl-terminal processing protease
MPLTRPLRAALCAVPVLLAACGGGGGGDGGIGPGGPPLSCSTGDQNTWLRSYFNDNYYWYALAPNPSPGAFGSVDAYFDALLYGGGGLIPGGGGATWPSDRYSFLQSTASFNQFFGDGRTLGYGVAVNGLEAVDGNATRLFVRYVEPNSSAALTGGIAGGLRRGDEILAIGGTPVATLIAANNFSALTPSASGDLVNLRVKRGTNPEITLVLSATVFDLTPVQNGQVLQSPNGRRFGYVFVKDMISQVGAPLTTTMTAFRNQGVQELVLDLRYNGGGLVSMGATVASYAGGSAKNNQVYTRLLYNDKQQASNRDFLFSNPNNWNGFTRAYVLMGERTCSASEQVINGLRGVGVNVVAIGDTTCGKPVGFLPADGECGTTFSVVNFEGVNAQNQGRYFNGLAPTCPVAEDFSRAIGALDDPLLTTAGFHMDNGACPVAGTREQPKARSGSRSRYTGADGGERTGMSGR